MNLSDMDVPIVGVVTRLTHQKGIHLIQHAAWRTLERGGQFVLLGSAPDPKVQVCPQTPSCLLHMKIFCKPPFCLLAVQPFRPSARLPFCPSRSMPRPAAGCFFKISFDNICGLTCAA